MFLRFYGFSRKEKKQDIEFLQSSLLCIVGKLAGGGSVAVAVGIGYM